jgi:hypothetical protein
LVGTVRQDESVIAAKKTAVAPELRRARPNIRALVERPPAIDEKFVGLGAAYSAPTNRRNSSNDCDRELFLAAQGSLRCRLGWNWRLTVIYQD